MKVNRNILITLPLCAALAAAQTGSSKQAAKRPPALEPAKSFGGSTQDPEARVVQYGYKDVIKVKAKIRYTTLIVLPKNETILDFACGDRDFWIVNGAQNFAYVKPAKPGAETNLNLITASGNVYSFALNEISDKPDAQPDLKIFVELSERSMATVAAGAPRFVSAQAVEDYRQQADQAKEETRKVKQASQAAIESGVNKFLANVRFPYRFEAGKRPFYVRAMYHDDRFTYIQARPEETPTLYEIKDGKPNLVNFEYKNGVYVVEKILDRGYLVVGKQRLGFLRQE